MLNRTSIEYLLLLTTTLALALCAYFSVKALWGQSTALFLAFAMSLSHYAMAYIWSIPGYIRAGSAYTHKTLALFFLGMFCFTAIVYWFALFSVSAVMLFVIFISVIHNARDFEFFFRQMRSDFTDYHRSSLANTFFSSFMFASFFGVLLMYTDLYTEKFGFKIVHFSPIVAQLAFFSSLGLFFVSVVKSLRKRDTALSLLFLLTTAPLIVSIVPYVFFKNVTLLDIFYIHVLWHYLLWYAFMLLKIVKRGQRSTEKPACIIGAISYFSSSVSRFLAFVICINLFFILPFFILLAYGRWDSISHAVAKSFLWGISGYVFFSVAHIYWSVLPRFRQQPLVPRNAR